MAEILFSGRAFSKVPQRTRIQGQMLTICFMVRTLGVQVRNIRLPGEPMRGKNTTERDQGTKAMGY